MSSLNKIMLIGNVGRDPDVRTTQNGTGKAEFSLATKNSYKPQGGERVDQTEWFNVVTWGTLAEQTASFVRKGRLVYVEGRFQSRKYTDQQGVEKVRYEVVASEVRYLDKKPTDDEGGMDVQDAPRTLVREQRPVTRPIQPTPLRKVAPTIASDDELLRDMGLPF